MRPFLFLLFVFVQAFGINASLSGPSTREVFECVVKDEGFIKGFQKCLDEHPEWVFFYALLMEYIHRGYERPYGFCVEILPWDLGPVVHHRALFSRDGLLILFAVFSISKETGVIFGNLSFKVTQYISSEHSFSCTRQIYPV